MNARPVSLCLLIVAMVAVGVWSAMPHGPGVSRDGHSYMQYARVIRGQLPLSSDTGVRIAVTHYPPGYPLMLAALNKGGLSLMSAARLIDAACFGLTCGTAAFVLLRHGRGTARAVVAAGLLLVQPALALIHLWVVSEPPFLLLTAVLFALLLEYRSGSGRGRTLAVAIGLCIASAGLVRYVGVAYAPAACWLVWRTAGRQGRRTHAVLVAAAAAVPMLILAVVQRQIAGGVADRGIGFEPMSAVHWDEFLRSVGGWLASGEPFGRRPLWKATAAGWVALTVAIALAATMAVGGRRSAFGRVAIVVSATYLALLLVSVTFVDHGTPLDDRLLGPVAMLGVLWFAADFPAPNAVGVPRWCRLVGTAAAVVVVASGVARWVVLAGASSREGLGFTTRKWRESPLVAAVERLPRGVLVYSNYPEPIWLDHGRDTHLLPGKRFTDPPPTPQDERYRAIALERLGRGGYVAFFSYVGNPRNPGKPMGIDEVLAEYPLRRVERFADGVLLRSNKAAAKQKPTTRAAE